MGTKYVLSLSGGKDSMATLILAKQHNEPLDAAVWARVMWDETRGAEHPEHDDWMMEEAIPKIEREWGTPVHVLESRKNVKAEWQGRSQKANASACCKGGQRLGCAGLPVSAKWARLGRRSTYGLARRLPNISALRQMNQGGWRG